MNVVYRGVVNPMTISLQASLDKVSTSLQDLVLQAVEKYNMSPTTGNEVVIDVTGTLPDGSKVSDKKTFRIRYSWSHRTIRRNRSGKGPKSNLK
jgi:hypothetical protein